MMPEVQHFCHGAYNEGKDHRGTGSSGSISCQYIHSYNRSMVSKGKCSSFCFYDKLSEVSTAWIDRCIVKSMTIGADEIDDSIDEIESCCGMNGPVLINIVGVKDDETSFDYRKWIDAIRQKEGNAKIRCYNAIQSDGIINIPSKDKYGVISKYIGMSVAVNVGYLLCTSECFLIDANVFRTRYANGNMKIILLTMETLRR